jgi:hypothetical protein
MMKTDELRTVSEFEIPSLKKGWLKDGMGCFGGSSSVRPLKLQNHPSQIFTSKPHLKSTDWSLTGAKLI